MTSISIRRVEYFDSPALENICLLTGDAGESAAGIHSENHQDLLGIVYALPYAHPALSSCTSGHVLVATDDSGTEEVVGYVLYSTDTRKFEQLTEEVYWPANRAKHPLPPDPSSDAAWDAAGLTPADRRIITLIHNTPTQFRAEASAIAFSPAHLHIDILPQAQGRGWGRRLIEKVVEDLAAIGLPGVWVGLDPRNVKARAFYLKLGFKPLDDVSLNHMGLRFSDWYSVHTS